MKRKPFRLRALTLSIGLIFAAGSFPLRGGNEQLEKGSLYLAGEIGLSSYVATEEPFASLPFPVGMSAMLLVKDNLGVGGTLMFDRWKDYLGMLGGKYTFHILRPSFTLTYHFKPRAFEGLHFTSGIDLGYSFVAVTNNLGNDYTGDLEHAPHIAPFLGTNITFRKESSGFWSRVMLRLKLSWSVTGDFSGLSGMVGIAYKIQ